MFITLLIILIISLSWISYRFYSSNQTKESIDEEFRFRKKHGIFNYDMKKKYLLKKEEIYYMDNFNIEILKLTKEAISILKKTDEAKQNIFSEEFSTENYHLIIPLYKESFPRFNNVPERLKDLMKTDKYRYCLKTEMLLSLYNFQIYLYKLKNQKVIVCNTIEEVNNLFPNMNYVNTIEEGV